MTHLLWPRHTAPADLKEIESIPLAQSADRKAVAETLCRYPIASRLDEAP